tara:strand:- start:6325 stop:6459 length:135 start_codon:yes stop_codon:yes gene_type:complete
MYDPVKNNSFVMQFGFDYPEKVITYKSKKNDRRKSSSNLSRLNE